jgi:hypothetical protein
VLIPLIIAVVLSYVLVIKLCLDNQENMPLSGY